jgi:type VI secretion system protein ImpH
MTVAFFGLTGPSGVLPTHYSELLIEAAGPDDQAGPLADFLDMFNHRLISLFYRAWERNHLQLSPDPTVRALFHGFVLAVLGDCSGGAAGPHARESLELLRHAGLWAQKRRTAEGLRILISDRTNDRLATTQERGERIEIEVVSFVPRWIQIDDERRLTLRNASSGGAIGQGALLGARACDWQGRFRLRIGPLTLRQFEELQPPAPSRGPRSQPSAFQDVVELTRRYVGPEFDFDLTLVLRADQVPRCRIERAFAGARLGRTWLTTRRPDHDCECIIRSTPPEIGHYTHVHC